MINRTESPVRVLMLSTMISPEIIECLDSGKTEGRERRRHLFKVRSGRSSGTGTMSTSDLLRIGSIVLRVGDLERQTEFWEAALDYERRDEQSDDFMLLRPRDGVGPNLSLDRVRSELQIPPRLPFTSICTRTTRPARLRL